MKTSDYLIDLMKRRIPEIIEPSDTAYGAFCKGYRYAKEDEWISEKMPEEFEDLVKSETSTKQVKVLLENGETTLSQRFQYSGSWYWSRAGKEKIVGWRCVE